MNYENKGIKGITLKEVKIYAGLYVIRLNGKIVFSSDNLDEAIQSLMRIYSEPKVNAEKVQKIEFFQIPKIDDVIF